MCPLNSEESIIINSTESVNPSLEAYNNEYGIRDYNTFCLNSALMKNDHWKTKFDSFIMELEQQLPPLTVIKLKNLLDKYREIIAVEAVFLFKVPYRAPKIAFFVFKETDEMFNNSKKHKQQGDYVVLSLPTAGSSFLKIYNKEIQKTKSECLFFNKKKTEEAINYFFEGCSSQDKALKCFNILLADSSGKVSRTISKRNAINSNSVKSLVNLSGKKQE